MDWWVYGFTSNTYCVAPMLAAYLRAIQVEDTFMMEIVKSMMKPETVRERMHYWM
jgi:hypothetical protein